MREHSRIARCVFRSLARRWRRHTTDGTQTRSRCHQLTETVDERPMRPFLWRFLDCDDNEIAAGPFRNDMGGGEMSFLPAIRLLRQFSFRIVDVNRNLRPLHLGPHPEPVLVAFEKLLANRLLLAYSEIAAPVILTNLEPFFHVRF